MDKEKLFKVNFIIQAVLTAVTQIINIVQSTKSKKRDEKEGSDKEG